MKIIEENDHEVYIELEPEDFPLTVESPEKKAHFRMKGQEFKGKSDVNGISVK